MKNDETLTNNTEILGNEEQQDAEEHDRAVGQEHECRHTQAKGGIHQRPRRTANALEKEDERERPLA